MANLKARDADGAIVELFAKGQGTPADPYYYGTENTASMSWKATSTANGYEIGEILFLKKQQNDSFVWCVVKKDGSVALLNGVQIPETHRSEINIAGQSGGFTGLDPTNNHQYFVSTVAGVPQKAWDITTGAELATVPTGLAFPGQETLLVGTAKSNGTGYTERDRVLLGLAKNGSVVSAYNIDTELDIAPLPQAKAFSYSTIESLNNNPRTPTVKFFTFTVPNTEQSTPLVSVKSIDIFNIHKVESFFGWALGNTQTLNCGSIQPNTYYFVQADINFTGDFVLSVGSVPTPLVLSSCTTATNSAVITGLFSAVVQGQLVTGTGIPADTYVKNKNSNSSQITLCDRTGITEVNATASSTTAQLTFSGAVVKIQTWS
jgi:hypothetical protein